MRASFRILVGAAAVAAVVAGTARGATPDTTFPGVPRYAFVVITDTKIRFTNNGPVSPFERGDLISFNVTNKGRKPHNFSMMGKTTKAIPPGKFRNTVFYNLSRRGKYFYRSTLDRNLRGHIIVE